MSELPHPPMSPSKRAAAKPVKAYAIKNPWSNIINPDNTRATQRDAWAAFIQGVGGRPTRTQLKSIGYRCIRVMIQPL